MALKKGTRLKTGTIHKRDGTTLRCNSQITSDTRTRSNWNDVDCTKCRKLKRIWTPFEPSKLAIFAKKRATKKRAGKKTTTKTKAKKSKKR